MKKRKSFSILTSAGVSIKATAGVKVTEKLFQSQSRLASSHRMETIQFLLLVVCVSYASAAIGGLVGRLQSAGVKGKLMCNGKPESNVLVKLYDDDRGLDLDDLMAKGKTDRNGYFELIGSNSEISTIDPKINIYHDCNDGWKPCKRKISVMIPDGYVTVGSATPSRIYDAGTIELSGKMKGETRDCFH